MFEITEEMKQQALRAVAGLYDLYDIEIVDTDDGTFIIVDSWEALSAINDAINQAVNPAWPEWRRVYEARGGTGGPFSELRIGRMRDGEERAPYLIPDDVLDIEEIADIGFSDEYTTCSHCGGLIRTTPDCYSWTPDFWLDDDGILCGDCVREDFAEDYIEDRIAEAAAGKVVGCYLLDPDDYGFVMVAQGLEHGLHPGQADDPRALIEWADESGLDMAFDVRTSQFSVSFDVYVRGRDEEVDVDAVRMALLGYSEESRYGDTLLAEFRQYPDPATLLQRSLRAASQAGERFVTHHGDGTYTAYDSAEEMFGAIQS